MLHERSGRLHFHSAAETLISRRRTTERRDGGFDGMMLPDSDDDGDDAYRGVTYESCMCSTQPAERESLVPITTGVIKGHVGLGDHQRQAVACVYVSLPGYTHSLAHTSQPPFSPSPSSCKPFVALASGPQ